MADIYGRLIAFQQQIYLNTGRLNGINEIKISPSLGNAPMNYIGIQNKPLNLITNIEQYIDVTINSNLVDYDPFIQFTGTDCFNMFIMQNQGSLNDAYSLVSGYLNSYSLKFSVGQPVQISAGMRFVKDAGQIPTGIMDSGAYNQLVQIPNNIYEDSQHKYHIPTFHSTVLTLNEIQTQRVIDASIDFKIARIPIYNIGNKTPNKINIVYPIKVNCVFSFEINQGYSGIEVQSIPANQEIQNISFALYEYNNSGYNVSNYILNNMTCIDEKREISTDKNVLVTKEFAGYIFN